MSIVYHKLVRDLIPDIIQKDGKKCTTKILTEKEYKRALREKLKEEMKEYIEAVNDKDSLDELADLLEIIHSLARIHGADFNTVERIRLQKANERGGFQNKVFLLEVEHE